MKGSEGNPEECCSFPVARRLCVPQARCHKALVQHTTNHSEPDQAGEAARAVPEARFPCTHPFSGVSIRRLNPSLAQPLPFPPWPSLRAWAGSHEGGPGKRVLLGHTAMALCTNCLSMFSVQCLLSCSHEFKYAIANCSLIYQCNL